MYGGFLPGVEMSDSAPSGVPEPEKLETQALAHSDEHLMHEQPTGSPKDEYFANDFANGVPDQALEQQPKLEEPLQQQEVEDADFWFVPNNLPPQQQVQIYNDKLMQLREFLESEQYQQETEQYRQQRINEIEQELADFGVAYKALQQNPKDFMAKYLPEVLMEYGVSPVLSQTEIAQRVEEQLKVQYGENYKEQINPQEMFNPGSFTSLVYQAQQHLFNTYLQQNAQNEALVRDWGKLVAEGKINSQQPLQQPQTFDALPPETQAAQLVQEYEQNWKQLGFSEDEFVEFVGRAQETSMSPHEVHKVVYFENYMTEAYKQGLEQGRQAMIEQLRKSGNASRVEHYNQPTQSSGFNFEEMDKKALFNQLSEGGIPYFSF